MTSDGLFLVEHDLLVDFLAILSVHEMSQKQLIFYVY